MARAGVQHLRADFVVPQQRHIVLMTLRRKSEVVRNSSPAAGKIWRILLDVVRLWSDLKWW